MARLWHGHASLKSWDALAEKTTRADQQHQQHEQIHGCLGELRETEADHQTLDQSNDEGSHDYAPERPKSTDHHHNECRGYDVVAHRGVDRENRRKHDASEAGKANAEEGDRGHVWLKRYAEGADHVRALHSSANDASKCGSLEQKPKAANAACRDSKHKHTVIGINEGANEQLTAQLGGNGEGQRRRTEDHAQELLGDHGQTESQDQGQTRIGLVETAKEGAL